MGFVTRELERLAVALREPQPPKRYCELYAAQQALSWSLDPLGYAAPHDVIVGGMVQPLRDDRSDTGDSGSRSASKQPYAKGSAMSSNPKPLVQVACVCEKVLIETDSVPSLIRIVDTYLIHTPSIPLPPGTGIGVELTAFIALRSGEVIGQFEIGLRLRDPEGVEQNIRRWPIVLNGAEHGANLRIDFGLANPKIGLYWFDVLWRDDEVLMSIPLRLKSVPPVGQASGSTENVTQ